MPAAEGWVSGILTIPTECRNASLATCSLCLNSTHPSKCLECAAKVQQQHSLIGAVLGKDSANGCAACIDGAHDRSVSGKCASCLISGDACARCMDQLVVDFWTAVVAGSVVQQQLKVDVEACIDCISQRGANFTGPCISTALG